MDFKEKIGSLVAEWGIPAAIGLVALGGCGVSGYMHKDDPKPTAEEQAKERAEYHKKHKDDAIPVAAFAPSM